MSSFSFGFRIFKKKKKKRQGISFQLGREVLFSEVNCKGSLHLLSVIHVCILNIEIDTYIYQKRVCFLYNRYLLV